MRAIHLASLLALAGGIVVACSTYASDDEQARPDAGGAVDAAASNDEPDAPSASDDAGPDGSLALGALNPACPDPTAGTFPSRSKEVLATPPAGEVEFPFEIDTDSRSVFWAAQAITIAQLDENGSAVIDAYNGLARSRIRRVSKEPGAQAETLVIEQQRTTTIALDGDYVYWPVAISGSATAIRRVRRDCVAPCTPEPVADLDVAAVDHLQRLADGKLFFRRENKDGYLLDVTTTPPGVTKLTTTNPFLTATTAGSDLFIGASSEDTIGRASGPTFSAFTPGWAKLPAPSSGQEKGPVTLGADCTAVYAARWDDAVWRVESDGGTFSRWLDAGADLGQLVSTSIDAHHVYLAAWNAGGVYAIDKKTRSMLTLHKGNVWHVFADKDGVYWGEHERSVEAGKLYTLRR
ncbi:MAG: hypothetical protein KIT84_14130 [Labilithrix sp.]|nr:hypothetical protein [Labilithrix sp.]MCW5812159.1 hypothetical protein [Labilithrix sp.]